MEVVYDEFRTDDTVVENANTTGSAQVIKQNTRATVEDDDAFVRLGLENPNSYAVAFEVQLSEKSSDRQRSAPSAPPTPTA